MKDIYKDRAAVKDQKPQDIKKSPFDFSCPQYDRRSGIYVSAGTDYGVGINQPVGTK